MIKRILLAYDGSAPADKAYAFALDIAKKYDAEQIIRHAEGQYKADLIVIGHRGKGLFERLRLGSVSKQVIQYAHCAVTVVR